MKMIIKFESGSFAALVRSNKKSLNMLTVLQHICEDNCVKLSMLPDEVCELINLDSSEIESVRAGVCILRKRRTELGINRLWI